jgi:hypothetical protein
MQFFLEFPSPTQVVLTSRTTPNTLIPTPLFTFLAAAAAEWKTSEASPLYIEPHPCLHTETEGEPLKAHLNLRPFVASVLHFSEPMN